MAIQPLLGFRHIKAHESNPQHRTHILTWHSLVLAAETDEIVGEQHLMALVWVGRIDKERAPWKVQSSFRGETDATPSVARRMAPGAPGIAKIVHDLVMLSVIIITDRSDGSVTYWGKHPERLD